jgi:hypothetical protein
MVFANPVVATQILGLAVAGAFLRGAVDAFSAANLI